MRFATALVLFLLANPASASDAEIRKVLVDRVGDAKGVGIVVGIIDAGGRRIISSSAAFNGDTVFEIGSVTKVFTALLVADMVQRGEVALDDPVAKFLPASTRIPSRNGRSITLVDLATHTAGLPFMAEGDYELTHDIGTTWDYSNIGYSLLGEALVARTHSDFETLLRTRITAPLKMNSTAITVSPKLKARMAIGRDAGLQPAPAVLAMPLYAKMAAAGGLVSTANDLLRFLAAAMGYERSPLGPSMAATLKTHRPKDANVEQALGWLIVGKGDDAFISHDGGTAGFASAVAWDPKQRIGVVVLANQVGDVNDIAWHLLRPEMPLAPKPVKHKEIALDPAALNPFVGKYEVEGEGVFTIAREGDALTIESPPEWGLPKLRLRPESVHDFFSSELPLRVTFQEGGMVIYPPRGQKGVLARKYSIR